VLHCIANTKNLCLLSFHFSDLNTACIVECINLQAVVLCKAALEACHTATVNVLQRFNPIACNIKPHNCTHSTRDHAWQRQQKPAKKESIGTSWPQGHPAHHNPDWSQAIGVGLWHVLPAQHGGHSMSYTACGPVCNAIDRGAAESHAGKHGRGVEAEQSMYRLVAQRCCREPCRQAWPRCGS
jgi:hypothetical protein